MPNARALPVQCADCGREIVGEPIVVSPTERLCQDCWPFFLKPIAGSAKNASREPAESVAHKD